MAASNKSLRGIHKVILLGGSQDVLVLFQHICVIWPNSDPTFQRGTSLAAQIEMSSYLRSGSVSLISRKIRF